MTAAISLAVMSSCSDFLDVQPEGTPTTTNCFTNDGQAIDAIDGLYKELCRDDQLFGRDLFWEQAAACDVVWGRSRSYNGLATLEYSGDESPLTGCYQKFYQIMARANWIVKKLGEKKETKTLTTVETRSLGEAYFMRAFAHFYIAYRYGTDKQGVPFVRYEDFEGDYDNSIPTQQASVVDNYKYIIEDLDNAEQYLPKFETYDADNRGRAHKASAVGYKAKVYAYWAAWDSSQWQNVITAVNSLENDYGRDLASSLDVVFSDDFADFWNKEYIFSIPSNGGSQYGGSEFPGIIVDNNGWGLFNGWGQNKPSYDIYEELVKDGEGNDRLRRTVLEYGQEFEFWGTTRRFWSTADLEAGFMINKYLMPFRHADGMNAGYVGTNGDCPTARINFPLIRFADCLLLRAEAYLATGQAAKATTDINRIRVRSNLTPLSGTATWTDLYHERRCELAFEFTDHLFDLKRWHKSGNAEIKALAAKELNAHPRVRRYYKQDENGNWLTDENGNYVSDRDNPDAKCMVLPYEDYPNKATYDDHLMVFPYPSAEVTKAGGLLKQNDGY